MIILLVSYALAMLKQELYEYQIGLMITNPQEDFQLEYKQVYDKSLNQKIIKVNNGVALISENNHKMDKVIDMKQNDYEVDDYIWILYQTDDKKILSKQYIDDQSLKENYYLQLNFECYTFYFISISQIVIDCQDQISNIIVLYDIKNKIQQSFYYSYYKDVRLRKMLLIYYSSSLVFIQQYQLIVLCLNQSKYQICHQLIFENNAHSAHIYDNQIILVSDYQVDVFDVIFQDTYQIGYANQVDLSKFSSQIKYPILFFLFQSNNFHNYIVSSTNLQICYDVCAQYVLEYPPIKVNIQMNYLLIQTKSTIYIFCMVRQKLIEINRQFTNDFLIANRDLEEFYIANKSRIINYGITYRPYLRITNQTVLIDKINFLNHYLITSYEYEKSMILFDPNFQFKRYNLLDQFQSFILIGGILNFNIQVEKQFQDKIRVKYSHFIEMEIQQDVQQFYLETDNLGYTCLKILKNQYLLSFNMRRSQFELTNKSEIDTEKFFLFQKVYSFNQGYAMMDNKTGLIYFVSSDDLQFMLIDCGNNFELFHCTKKLYVCFTDDILIFYFFEISAQSQIKLKEHQKILYFDLQSSIIYFKYNNNLSVSYYPNYFQNPIHTQTIKLCNNFINLVVQRLKLIIVCSEQMIIYNKVSKYRYLISGSVELQGQQFEQTSKVIQTEDQLFYIIDNLTLHVFNGNLPLSQLYVYKMQLSKFDDVKARNEHICFSDNNNLKCYYYSINIRFLYDHEQVEYHQVFKVNVCAENQYNKKCKQYITRLDQQNRGIQIKHHIYQVIINEKTSQIKFDDRFYSGSVDKIFVNNLQLKPKILVQSYIKMTYDIGRKTYHHGFDNTIYSINGQTLLIYNIENKETQRKKIQKNLKSVFQHRSNLLLIGITSISVLNPDQDYKEIIYYQFKISHRGLLYVYNNSLYTTQFTSLRIYSLENLETKPLEYVDEELDINIIDFSTDNDEQLCMVYLDFRNQLIFRYKETNKRYNLIEALRQLGIFVDFSQFDAIHSIKLLNNCKVILIFAHFGSHFFELEEKLVYLSQIVIFNPSFYQSNTLLIGLNYLFYIQQQDQSIFICKFTYDQIYESRFIDFHYRLIIDSVFDLKDFFFHAHNDELYIVQLDKEGLIIKHINLDSIIQIDNLNNQIQHLLVTLSNSDETKSFIIEMLLETSNQIIFQCITIVLFLIFYIFVLLIKMSEKQK